MGSIHYTLLILTTWSHSRWGFYDIFVWDWNLHISGIFYLKKQTPVLGGIVCTIFEGYV